MAVQWGAMCFPDNASASVAACGSFGQVQSFSSDGLHSYVQSCAGELLDSDGGIVVNFSDTLLSSGVTTNINYDYWPTYLNCQWDDYIAGGEILIGAVLGLWAIWWGGKKLLELLNWSREM